MKPRVIEEVFLCSSPGHISGASPGLALPGRRRRGSRPVRFKSGKSSRRTAPPTGRRYETIRAFVKTPEPAGVGRFHFAVGAAAGDHDSFCFHGITAPSTFLPGFLHLRQTGLKALSSRPSAYGKHRLLRHVPMEAKQLPLMTLSNSSRFSGMDGKPGAARLDSETLGAPPLPYPPHLPSRERGRGRWPCRTRRQRRIRQRPRQSAIGEVVAGGDQPGHYSQVVC